MPEVKTITVEIRASDIRQGNPMKWAILRALPGATGICTGPTFACCRHNGTPYTIRYGRRAAALQRTIDQALADIADAYLTQIRETFQVIEDR